MISRSYGQATNQWCQEWTVQGKYCQVNIIYTVVNVHRAEFDQGTILHGKHIWRSSYSATRVGGRRERESVTDCGPPELKQIYGSLIRKLSPISETCGFFNSCHSVCEASALPLRYTGDFNTTCTVPWIIVRRCIRTQNRPAQIVSVTCKWFVQFIDAIARVPTLRTLVYVACSLS